MKRYTLTMLTAMAIAAISFAQPALQWDARFHGPIANDEGKAITVDAAGNVYVTGTSDNPNGTSDYLTIKYGANGDTLWSRRYDGSANEQDRAVAIKADPAGNVYVTGASQGIGTGSDIVTIKYNSSGTEQWAAVYNGVGDAEDIGYNLVVDVFGNVYVVGSSNGNSVILKYNASGEEQWSKKNTAWYNPITSETNYLIDINAHNNLVVAIDEPDAVGNFIIQELNPFTGQTILEYNTPFIQVFWGTPSAMALDGAGNIYLLSTQYTSSGVPVKIRITRFTHGVVAASGGFTYQVNGGRRISGVDLKLDAELNIYVLASYYNQGTYGYFTIKSDASDFDERLEIEYSDPDRDNIPVGLALKNEADPDIFVTGYSSMGEITTVGYDNDLNPLWDAVIYDCGNNGFDIAAAMVMDTEDCSHLYITGNSNCDNTFRDVKTIKYSISGPTQPGPINGNATVCEGISQTYSVTPVTGATSYTWTSPSGWSMPDTGSSITATAGSSGVITVIANNDCGSSTPQTLEVAVSSAPSDVSASVSQGTLCIGDAVNLFGAATGATSWSWDGPSGFNSTLQNPAIDNIQPDQAGSYTVTASNACGSASASVELAVIQVDISVTQDSLTLTASATPASYQWLDCGNAMQAIDAATNQSFTPEQTGNYAVQVTQNGCTDTSMCYAVTVLPSGTDEMAFLRELIIYPNPNTGRFTVFLKSNSTRSIEVLCKNLLGQSVFLKEYNLANRELKIELDLSTAGKGLYLVQVRNKGQSVFRKVIITE